MQKKLIGLFIIGGCVLGFFFNPYIGIIESNVVLTQITLFFRVIFQFIIMGYVIMNYVLPCILDYLKKIVK